MIKPVTGLKYFAGRIIDYAGLFPPASLTVAQAFNNYLFYSQSEHKWMLNKFIIPVKKLDELGKLIDEMMIQAPVPLSIIGSGGETASQFTKNLSADMKKIDQFLSGYGEFTSVDVFEVKLPVDITEQEEADDMLDLMISASADFETTLGKDLPVFYEALLDDKYESTMLKIVENIASLNNRCGYKLRTGGTEAAAFPDADRIAFAIMTCAEFNIPMKCTAGLHHPIKHFNESVDSYMHGFFNVFGAGILAYSNNLDEAELLEVLNDEDPDEFMFDENGFEWNEIEVTNEEIKEARVNLITSYGSCSFEEPIDDLKIMELL